MHETQTFEQRAIYLVGRKHLEEQPTQQFNQSIIKEKKRRYQGIVKTKIEDLVFAPDNSSCNGNIECKKVDKLKCMFEKEGCDRINPRNPILGEVSEEIFVTALRLSKLAPEDIQREEPTKSHQRCLGIRRLGNWWTIELYTKLEQDVFDTISENYVNEGSLSDGRIYAKIVYYHSRDPLNEAKWRVRLSEHKSFTCKKLIEHACLGSPLLKVIFQIPSMHDQLELGTWHKIIGAKCDEEFARYLHFLHGIKGNAALRRPRRRTGSLGASAWRFARGPLSCGYSHHEWQSFQKITRRR
ncbi:uncharacterized protein FMAN_15496 [Fusarium mangiferae]|uniref:Uncharacterized protein n=1 Tax=Fusarium mangiferae TaxID=192010 RepID=A0A1L7UJD6_FUSMA|nr:uncharacterized protein FMAN_15496 [Fusarium mangiferae]CVL09332.1 uncharacterized protein FMAN_15496 [Fusarium mangiferae]